MIAMQRPKPLKAICISFFAFVLSTVLNRPFSASIIALFSLSEKSFNNSDHTGATTGKQSPAYRMPDATWDVPIRAI